MQAFQFFLASTGFSVAGYGAAIGEVPEVSAAIGSLLAFLALFFLGLEIRNKVFMDIGEKALMKFEMDLPIQLRTIAISERMTKTIPRESGLFRSRLGRWLWRRLKHGNLIRSIELIVMTVSLLGTFFALARASVAW
jgi:hypothetical protein